MLLIKFFKLSLSDKRMILEIVFFLFILRVIIILLPYSFLKPLLGKYNDKSLAEEHEIKVIRRISYWISRLSCILPLKCNCLPKAITGKLMLKIRGINSTLYLGMSKNKDKKLIAHAWLKVGNIPVTGCRNNGKFVEVAYFG